MSDFLGPYGKHLAGHPPADRRRGSRRDAPLPRAERRQEEEERDLDKSRSRRFYEDDLTIAMIGGYLVAFSQIPPSTDEEAIDICEARIIADPAGPLSSWDPIVSRRADLPLQDYSRLSLIEARMILDYFGTEAELPFMPPLGDE